MSKSPMNLRKKPDTGRALDYDKHRTAWEPPRNPRGRGCGTVNLTPRYRKSTYAPWG